MKNAPVNFYCYEALSDRKDYALIEAFRSWEQFVCNPKSAPYSSNIALQSLLEIFAEFKESFKTLALHCEAIKDLEENINSQAFHKTIKHVEDTCDLPDYQDFYNSVKKLRRLEISKSVEYYFTKFSESISLPYRDFVLRDEFNSWHPDVEEIYASFVLKLRKSCPNTRRADRVYVNAARSSFKGISDFLKEYPEIAKVCFDHINTFKIINEYYQNFCKIKKEAEKYFTCFLDFCIAIEEVSHCFLKNSDFVTLPHTNIKQFEEFQISNQEVGNLCEELNNKIHANCLTNSQLCYTYVEAVASKKTFNPGSPTAFPSLVNKNAEPLEDFLRQTPSVTRFFYENLEIIDTLSEYYRTFHYKQLPKLVQNFFKDPDYFNFLKQLTNESFIEKLEAEKNIEKDQESQHDNDYLYYHQAISHPKTQCENVYQFATDCMKIISELKKHEHCNGESLWLALHNILHTGNDTNARRLKALFSCMQKKPNLALFFNNQRHKIIELANVYRSQCIIVSSKINKNRAMLFTAPMNNHPKKTSENSDQPFKCSP